jgi:hypothetical protein
MSELSASPGIAELRHDPSGDGQLPPCRMSELSASPGIAELRHDPWAGVDRPVGSATRA